VPEVKRKIQQAFAAIHSMQCHIKEVYCKWHMLSGLKRDDAFSQDISFMEEGYACAKCTAGVVAAASIALEMKGSEQSAAGHAAESTRRSLGRPRQRQHVQDACGACEAGAARQAACATVGGSR